MTPRLNHFFVAISLVVLTISALRPARAEDLTVFAAASLTDAMTSVAKAYEASQPDDHISLSFASSSTLARQIAAGAPAGVYLSANEKWMDWIEGKGLVAQDTRFDLLGNSLVLISPKDSKIKTFKFDKQTKILSKIGAQDRIAIGDPDHVPAGIYGKQALVSLKQWKDVEPRLARADNVRAALALVAQGETPLGIVYGTDAAISKNVKVVSTFPADSHPPITYPAAAIKGLDSPAAKRLLSFLQSDKATAIFRKFGFVPPVGK